MTGHVKGWMDFLSRSDHAAQTAANLKLTDRISADVTLAQAQQSAADNNANVQRKVADVHAQAQLAELEHARLVAAVATQQSQVDFLVNKYKTLTAAGDTAGAAAVKVQGAQAATALTAKQNELHTNEALLANLQTALTAADNAAAASDQQLQDAQAEAERLNSLKVQAALARATASAVADLTSPSVNGATATMADATKKIQGEYAAAIGMQAVVDHSAAAQGIALQVEMHQAAGANLFDQAVAAASSTPEPAPVA